MKLLHAVPLASLLLPLTALSGGATVDNDVDFSSYECTIIVEDVFEVCVGRSGKVVTVETPSGNLSISADVEGEVEVYEFGELIDSISFTDKFHGLDKGDGVWFQAHEDFCQESSLGFSFDLFINVANGEVKHEVVIFDEGCE